MNPRTAGRPYDSSALTRKPTDFSSVKTKRAPRQEAHSEVIMNEKAGPGFAVFFSMLSHPLVAPLPAPLSQRFGALRARILVARHFL
jgi:hypothetical protein